MRKTPTLFHDMFKSYRDPNYKIFLKTKEIDEGGFLFETTLVHPAYNDGEEFSLGCHRNKKDAVEAHNYWYEHICGATQIATNNNLREEDFFKTNMKTSPP